MRVDFISMQNTRSNSKQQFAGIKRINSIEGGCVARAKADTVELAAKTVKAVKRGRKPKAEKTVVEKQPQRSETEQRYHDSGDTTMDRLRSYM